jgi:hypothetical protein
VLSGAPQFSGLGNVQVSVTDSSTPPQSAGAVLTVDIFGFATGSSTSGRTDVGGSSSMGIFLVGAGTAPVTWSIASGTVPGMTVKPYPDNSRTAYMYGLATQPGTFNFTLRAQDSSNPPRVDTSAVTLVVSPAPLQLTTQLLPHATLGQAYSQQLAATGGIPPYTWSLDPFSDKLPAGLSLNAGTGVISGTPTAPGTNSLVLDVTDGTRVATQVFPLYVAPVPLPPRNDALATATPIYPGYYYGSISPYGNPSAGVAPDTDYYRMSAAAGTTWRITVTALDKNMGVTGLNRALDAALELLDANGIRLATCNDPADDNPPPGVPITKDSTPSGYDDPCMNNGTDFSKATGAYLDVSVPGSGNVDFYIHVFDWRGSARPDMYYRLDVKATP